MRDSHHHIPTARDVMTRSLVTVDPDATIIDAIRAFLANKISGAPVVDSAGEMVGILSEADCLRVLASGEFYSDDHGEEGLVADYMTAVFRSIPPDLDIYAIAQIFLDHSLRRLPVMDGSKLIGQVSRRDVLRAMEELAEKRVSRKHYPDYKEPSQEVGARRTS